MTDETLRTVAETLRTIPADEYTPIRELAIGECITWEAWWFRAVDVVFDAIPEERWIEA